MTDQPLITPARSALKPILSDEPLFDLDGEGTTVFYTPSAQWIAHRMEVIVAVTAGVFLLIAWGLTQAGGPVPLQHLFTMLAFAVAGIPALESVWGKLKSFRIDIDLLMLLGAVLAAYIDQPFEGALLLFLFALSGAMESYAVRRTQSAIVALRELAPKFATVVEGDSTKEVPLRQVAVGARILVRPGDKVPLDGTVVDGSSSLNESAITGESVPRERTIGDPVLAGTQNLNGRLEVEVTKLAADTTLARIVKLVTAARHKPARAQRLIDRIGPTYSVVVILGAVLVGVVCAVAFGIAGNEAVRRGIAVLIVASPCALIIATPVAYLAAIACSARNGVLVKGSADMEAIANAGAVVFDKTGTLTTGTIRLTDVTPLDGLTEAEALRFAGAIEKSSTHPLATAINNRVTDSGVILPSVSDYILTPGEGASAMIEGKPVWIGRPERCGDRLSTARKEGAAAVTERFRKEGKTVATLAVDGHAAVFAFGDTVRDESKDCIARLKRQGVVWTEMLTGDHSLVAERVSTSLGLDGFRAELFPDDKLQAVESIRREHGNIVVVGDGINDAPALVHADVGIAMGKGGTDVAMEAADVVLMNDRIEAVAWLHLHGKRTATVVRQNLTFAIAVISVLSVFAAMGSVPLPLAVIGHEGSTVLVSLNALRLLRT